MQSAARAARGGCWSTTDPQVVEALLRHMPDDAGAGLVIFDGLIDGRFPYGAPGVRRQPTRVSPTSK